LPGDGLPSIAQIFGSSLLAIFPARPSAGRTFLWRMSFADAGQQLTFRFIIPGFFLDFGRLVGQIGRLRQMLNSCAWLFARVHAPAHAEPAAFPLRGCRIPSSRQRK
jgi:hypothetical protein